MQVSRTSFYPVDFQKHTECVLLRLLSWLLPFLYTWHLKCIFWKRICDNFKYTVAKWAFAQFYCHASQTQSHVGSNLSCQRQWKQTCTSAPNRFGEIFDPNTAWKWDSSLPWPEVIFFLSALRASLTRVRREPSVSIAQKYPLDPRVPLNKLFLNNWHFEVINREIKHRVFGKRQTYICTTWPSFPVNCRLPVYYNYTKIGRFTSILFITIVLICWLLTSHFEKFSTWIFESWIRLPLLTQ